MQPRSEESPLWEIPFGQAGRGERGGGGVFNPSSGFHSLSLTSDVFII